MVALGCFMQYAALGFAAFGSASAFGHAGIRTLNSHLLPSVGVDAAATPIQEYNFSVPIDHFHNDTKYAPHTNDTFNLRYFLDTTYYKPGGPVIVLLAGEGPAALYLIEFQTSITSQIAKATNAMSVILEHRYYGTSFPFLKPTLDQYRFLTTDQAMADTAYFAKNIKFPGFENVNLTSSNTSWFTYGSSYAGAFSAIMRKVYPDVFWGAISSAGVTAATEDYWQYWESARLYSPGDCGPTTGKITRVIDNVLLGGNQTEILALKKMFGLQTLNDLDFATTVGGGISNLQLQSTNPNFGGKKFGIYCSLVMTKEQLFHDTTYLKPAVQRLIRLAGFDDSLTNQMLNYIGYYQQDLVETLIGTTCLGKSVQDCLDATGATLNGSFALLESWTYQACTQWGFWQTGSGYPKNINPVVSRVVSLDAYRNLCKQYWSITTPVDTKAITKYGGFNFSYPRVAMISGFQDPWRQATPLANGQPPRYSTPSEPILTLNYGVHAWDEFGDVTDLTILSQVPPYIADVQRQEVQIIQRWTKEWHDSH